ncbi:hypothetical protein IEQ34_018101 [Dendrobium chrysotoxum]|uniref:Uncharacterized protein n=1 Tax=Dendrobium chrysotoxum TaxID=161865 RepID=A0AAV7GCD5_DENCH|nr:hypothetical protein IEQ34_018101 [Dendrobium chrysotoxum]
MAHRIHLTVVFLLSAAASLARFDDDSRIRPFSDPNLPIMNRFSSTDPAFLQALGTSFYATRFALFAKRYGRSYDSVHELRRRFGIFKENFEQIKATNRKGLSYSLAVNHFADLTWEEFRASWLGASQNCSAALKPNHILNKKKLPKEKDWRKDGIVSPVKNQGNCGSCWAFSATGAIEAAYTQLTGKAISLSEQQLIDCSLKYNNFGCAGGYPSQAFQYIKDNGGIEAEKTYPYLAADGKCRFKKENVRVKGDEDELKHAVGNVRPVTVGMEVVPDFRFYKKGVFSSDTCSSSPDDLNHAVLVIGYGVEEGIPYWLIKNSWGKRWGDNGFFKIELGKNMCGVATCATYPNVAA